MSTASPFALEGATILITGGGTGIGHASAAAMVEAGASRVILCGRREDKLREVKAQLTSGRTLIETLAVDVTLAQGRESIKHRMEEWGPLDGLVNNAGLFESFALSQTTDAQWERIFAINAEAPFQLIRDLLPFLRKSKHPAIVNVSSTLAEKPIPNTVAYNASKAALIQMSRSLALELAPEGIRVNAVMPGVVETDMYRGRYKDEASYTKGIAFAAKLHPLGRVGQPEDVARAVQFLLSPAAGWITGVSLPVDGGMLVT